MAEYISHSTAETEAIAAKFAEELANNGAVATSAGPGLNGGVVLAFFGGMGMGKTAFVRGLAKGMGLDSHVSSPTFAIVNDYGGTPPLVHFDMYRVSGWEDLYTTGFFDYLDMGGVLAVEWSENIENALPEDGYIRVDIAQGEKDDDRIITVKGVGRYENFSD